MLTPEVVVALWFFDIFAINDMWDVLTCGNRKGLDIAEGIASRGMAIDALAWE